MVTFRAEIDQMAGLAQRLDGVRATLESEDHRGLDGTCLGQGDAAGALADFVSGWSHGRSEIVDGVNRVQSGLRGASTNYRGSDEGMAAKL